MSGVRFSGRNAIMLFLRYAIPCGTVLVKRRSLSESRLKSMKDALLKGCPPAAKTVEKAFPVGARMCMISALKSKKRSIDEETVRRYFIKEHRKAVKWRIGLYSDVNPKKCIVRKGKVISHEGRMALIRVRGKVDSYSTALMETPAKAGETVFVHYGYAIEKAS